jgi:hypothetical protein
VIRERRPSDRDETEGFVTLRLGFYFQSQHLGAGYALFLCPLPDGGLKALFSLQVTLRHWGSLWRQRDRGDRDGGFLTPFRSYKKRCFFFSKSKNLGGGYVLTLRPFSI